MYFVAIIKLFVAFFVPSVLWRCWYCASASAKVSDYSRHIAGGKFPPEIRNSPRKFEIPLSPEIRQREKFGQLILMRIIEIVATWCEILRLKCTKFDFDWGSTPDPAGAPPPQTPYLHLRGLLLGEGKQGRTRYRRAEREDRGGKGMRGSPALLIPPQM